MPVLRRRRPSFRRARPRKTYEWAMGEFSAVVNPNTSSTATTPLGGFESDFGSDIMGWRIERVLINGFAALTTGTTAATTGALYTVLMYIDRSTFTAIPTSHWPPNTFWLRHGGLTAAGALTTGNAPAGGNIDKFSVDLRVRRRFKDLDDECRLAVHNRTAANDEIFFQINWNILLSKV